MQRQKANITFFHQKRNDAIGCIIRISGKEDRFMTGRKVPAKYWESGKAIGKFKELNKVFAQIEQELTTLHDTHFNQGRHLTAKELKRIYCTKDKPTDNTFLAVQQAFLADLEKLGKIGKGAIDQRKRVARHFEEFLKEIGQSDLAPQDLKTSLARDYEIWLSTAKQYKNDYIARHTDQLIEILDFAVVMELSPSSPLNSQTFRIGRDKQGNPDSLTLEQVLLLKEAFESQFFASKPLQKANDLFLFSCFTAMNHADLLTFDYEAHTTEFEGKKLITKPRQKTKIEAIVPIAPIVEKILVFYEYKLPVFKDVQVYNRFIKQVFAIHGIVKDKISSKLARSTFGTLILNSSKAGFDDLARMYGHSRVGTTQTYYTRAGKERIARNTDDISYLKQ